MSLNGVPIGATDTLTADKPTIAGSRPSLVFASGAGEFFLSWYTASPNQYRGVGWSGVGTPPTQHIILAQSDPVDTIYGSPDAQGEGPAMAYNSQTGEMIALWAINNTGSPNYDIWERGVVYVPPTPTPSPTTANTATPTATATPSGPPFVQVRGVVRDCETGAPVPNAEVTVLGTSLRAFTDISGVYQTGQLSLETQNYTIRATAAGRATMDQVMLLQNRYTPYEVNFAGNACLGPAPTVTPTIPATDTPTPTRTPTHTPTTAPTVTQTPTPTRTPIPVYYSYLPLVYKNHVVGATP